MLSAIQTQTFCLKALGLWLSSIVRISQGCFPNARAASFTPASSELEASNSKHFRVVLRRYLFQWDSTRSLRCSVGRNNGFLVLQISIPPMSIAPNRSNVFNCFKWLILKMRSSRCFQAKLLRPISPLSLVDILSQAFFQSRTIEGEWKRLFLFSNPIFCL